MQWGGRPTVLLTYPDDVVVFILSAKGGGDRVMVYASMREWLEGDFEFSYVH